MGAPVESYGRVGAARILYELICETDAFGGYNPFTMRQRTLVLFVAASLFVSATTLAEEFWDKKDYGQWSEDEVRKLITNSPWAKDVTITAPAAMLGGLPRGSAAAGTDVESGGGGGGRGRRGGGGGGGGGGAAASQVLITLNISWRSALPMKQGLVRGRQVAGVEIPQTLRDGLAQEEENYVIVVSGLPLRMLQSIQNPEQLKNSVLRRGKKDPIHLAAVDFQTRTQSVDLICVFPRTDRITPDDKEIEVVMKLGPLEAKRKFNLKDMVYKGKLEL